MHPLPGQQVYTVMAGVDHVCLDEVPRLAGVVQVQFSVIANLQQVRGSHHAVAAIIGDGSVVT